MCYRQLLVIIWSTRHVLEQESSYVNRPLHKTEKRWSLWKMIIKHHIVTWIISFTKLRNDMKVLSLHILFTAGVAFLVFMSFLIIPFVPFFLRQMSRPGPASWPECPAPSAWLPGPGRSSGGCPHCYTLHTGCCREGWPNTLALSSFSVFLWKMFQIQ